LLFRNVLIMGWIWLSSLFTYSICSNSAINEIMGQQKMTNLLPKSPQNFLHVVFQCGNQALRIVSFLGCSPNINSSCRSNCVEGINLCGHITSDDEL
jgi:hypothetical protein